MADWFLILVTSISFFLLLVVSVYILVHYQHPDDKNDAYFPKLTVLLGLLLSGATVLLLPLDVANNEGYPGCAGYAESQLCGGINMVLFWEIFYWAIPAVVFLLIPFMTFFYEADDGMLMAGTAIGAKPNSRILEAIKYEFLVIIIVGSIFIGCYLGFGESHVMVKEYTGYTADKTEYTTLNIDGGSFNTSYLEDLSLAEFTTMHSRSQVTKEMMITLPVSIPTFFAGFMAFIGWFFFALFGGIGIAALPLDLILAFINRPKHMDPSEFADAQMNIRQRVNELVDIGELLKIERDERAKSEEKKGMFQRFSREGQKEYLEFKKAVYLLETDVEDFQASSANYANYNPLIPWLSLFLGFFSVIISLVWVVHIAIYIAPPKPLYSFLNDFFQIGEDVFPLFGVLSIAIFTLYLLLCAIKGCFKFGIRFMMFQIHPMRVNKTYMSSFMFNVGLVLLCALPVVQFCVTAFPEYARYSNVVQVMGVQVQNLKFFTWFFAQKIFIFAFLAVAGLTCIYLFCKPRDKEKKTRKGLLSRLRSKK